MNFPDLSKVTNPDSIFVKYSKNKFIIGFKDKENEISAFTLNSSSVKLILDLLNDFCGIDKNQVFIDKKYVN